MIENNKRGKSRVFMSWETRYLVALDKKKEIEKKITLLNQVYEQEEIGKEEYSRMLDDFNRLKKEYADYSEDCLRRISRGEIQEESIFKKNLPIAVIVLLLSLALILPFTMQGGLTGSAISGIEWTGENSFETYGEFRLNLNDYFQANETLTYYTSEAENMNIAVENGELIVIPEEGFVGEREITIYASDSEGMLDQKITLTVMEREFGVGLPEPVIEVPVEVPSNETIVNETTEPVEEVPVEATEEPVETPVEEPAEIPAEEPLEIPVEELPAIIAEQTVTRNNKYFGEQIVDGPIAIEFSRVEQTSDKLILEFTHNSDRTERILVEGISDYVLDKEFIAPGETARLEAALVKGIAPKFRLHLGSQMGTFSVSGVGTEIYSFGKTIPFVVTNGNYSLSDRDDKKIDLEIAKESSKALIKGVDASLVEAKILETNESMFATDIILAEPVVMESAEITLRKTGAVSAVMECAEVDLVTMACLGEWQETEIPFVDNGDTITFTVDHFSGYAGAELDILNVQSYPTVGNSWEVRFNTTGVADLIITPFNGTTWTDYSENASLYDLKLLKIKCGETVLNYTWFNDSVLVENYSCDETGYEISKVLTEGEHHLEFRFGDDVEYAHNFAEPELVCTVRTGSCDPIGGEATITTISSKTNAHIGEGFDESVCCFDMSERNTVSAAVGTNILDIYEGHAEVPGTTDYPTDIILGVDKDDITCSNDAVSGICTGGKACVLTISGTTDAHVADCTTDPYELTVCCGIDYRPPVYGETITEDEALEGDLTGSGDAITIGANSTGLYCNGYALGGDNSGDGINAANFNNIVVDSCTFTPDTFVNDLDISDATNVDIIDSVVDDYSFSNVAQLSVQNSYGSVEFSSVTGTGSNLFGASNSVIVIGNNLITVNVGVESEFDVSANLVINNINPGSIPQVNDGTGWKVCTECTDIVNAGTTLYFTAPGFSSYRAGGYLLEELDWDLMDLWQPSIVAGDVNGDGLEDVVITGTGGSGVYINNGTALVLNAGWGVNNLGVGWGSNALVDVDGDGDLDYMQFGEANQDTAFTNTGSTLSQNNWLSAVTDLEKASVALGDIDNDGDYDLIITGKDGGMNYYTKVYLFDGSAYTYSGAWTTGLENVADDDDGDRIVLADFDKDCDLDLWLFGKKSSGERVGYFYRNMGSSFSRTIGWEGNMSLYSDAGIAVGDVDNDGDLDLAIFGKSYNQGDTCNMADFCVLYGPGSGACGMGGPNICPDGISFCFQDSDCDYCASVGVAMATPTCSVLYGGTDQNSDCWYCTIPGPGSPSCTSNVDCWTETQKGFVYTNNGTALVESQSILSLFRGSAVFGDLDNNGYIDLFVSGQNSSGSPERAIYTNNAGTFTINSSWSANILARYNGVSSLFIDFNNDSKLDLAVGGTIYNTSDWCNFTNQTCDTSDTCNLTTFFCNNNPQWPCPGGLNSECYFCPISMENRDCTQPGLQCDPYTCVASNLSCNNNNATCYTSQALTEVHINNYTVSDTLPNAATAFTFNHTGTIFAMNWSGASDAETATAGLYYNLRVGSTNGSNDIRSGAYPRTSNPTAGYFGNTMTKIFTNLTIPESDYYWAVQTIDAALGKSAWSTTQFYNYTLVCGNKDRDVTFNENFTTDNSAQCFNITVDNITIDCAGYNIVGNGSNIAINANGRTGIIIKDCNFFNFSQDIVFYNTNNSLIDNVDVIINISNSDGDIINNSIVEALYVTNSSNVRVTDSSVANYTLSNATYFMVENSSSGMVRFLQSVTESGLDMFGSSTSDIAWQYFILSVDSANEPGFNVSANVSVYNIVYAWPRTYVNLSTNYTLCNATTDPACVNLSYSGTTFVFNISHFTDVQVREGAYLVSNSTPVQNLPAIGLDPTLVLLRIDSDDYRDIHLTGYDGNLGQYYNNIYFDDGNRNYASDGVTDSLLTGVAYSGAAWGDYDLDGDSDLVYCGYNGGWVGHAFKNNGGGNQMTQDAASSSNITDIIYCSVSMGDIDNDGDLDLAMQGMTAGFLGDCSVYNNSNGTLVYNAGWSSNCTGKYYGALSFVDVNNDSWVDLVSVGTDGANRIFEVLINQQNGTGFVNDSTWGQNLVGEDYARLAWGDLDNNGLRDMVVHGNAAGGPETYWYNNTGSTFSVAANHDFYNVTRGAICMADFNADGYRDVYMTGSDETLGIFGVYRAGVWLNNAGGSLSYSQAYSVNLTGYTWATCFTVPGSQSDILMAGSTALGDPDVIRYMENQQYAIDGVTDLEPVVGEPPVVYTVGNEHASKPGDGNWDDNGEEKSDLSFKAQKDDDSYAANFWNMVQGGSSSSWESGTIPYSSTWTYVDNDLLENEDISYKLIDPTGQESDWSLETPTLESIEIDVEDLLPISVADTSGDCSISSDQSKGLVPNEIGWCNAGNWSTEMRNLTFNITTNFQKFNTNLTVNNTFTNSTVFAGFVNYTNATSSGHILASWWNLSALPGTSNSTFAIIRNFTGYQTVPFTAVHGAGIFWAEVQGQKNITYIIETYACTPSTC